MAEEFKNELGRMIVNMIDPLLGSGLISFKDVIEVHAGHLAIAALAETQYDVDAARDLVKKEIDVAFQKALDKIEQAASEYATEVPGEQLPPGVPELLAKLQAQKEGSTSV